MSAPTFPAKDVVGSYRSLEQKLADVLVTVPYCAAHENVWSPSLVTVLLEAGSQLDSLWRAQSRLSRFTKSDPNVVDYFTYFGQYLGYRLLVFWGEVPVKLSPFAEWHGTAAYSRSDYVRLPWWEAYTQLKHDRLANREMASLKNSVTAVAALFLAVLHCEQCRDEIVQAKWLSGLYDNPAAWLAEHESTVTWNQWITAETNLFTYPVGWCRQKIVAESNWDATTVSHRFFRWYQGYSQEAS